MDKDKIMERVPLVSNLISLIINMPKQQSVRVHKYMCAYESMWMKCFQLIMTQVLQPQMSKASCVITLTDTHILLCTSAIPALRLCNDVLSDCRQARR